MKNIFRLNKGIFADKKIIIVSKNKITTKRVSVFSKIFKSVLFFYLIYNNVLYINTKKLLVEKNKQITELTAINDNLKVDVENVNIAVNNLGYYFKILNKYDRFTGLNIATLSNEEFLDRNNVKSARYAEVSPMLERLNNDLNSINNTINNRISNLENIIANVGITQDELKNIYRVSYQDKGENYTSSKLIEKNSVVVKDKEDLFGNKISYMTYLEDFLDKLPMSEPINNYRYTSQFGWRNHPFDRETKFHRGVDMAGPINTKVVSPSNGTVVFAGTKGGYGNYIKLDHGNGITTEYGHLKKVIAKKGDTVRRGQTIGIQGSTGMSTGDHLHYEVKFKRRPIDPRFFIENGNKMF